MFDDNVWRRIDYGNFIPLNSENWQRHIERNFGPIKKLYIATAEKQDNENLHNFGNRNKPAGTILNELTEIGGFPVSHLWHFAALGKRTAVTVALKWDHVAVVSQRSEKQKSLAKRYASESLLHALDNLNFLPRSLREILPFEAEDFLMRSVIALIIEKPDAHPVSKLYEIQQARKRPPPIFQPVQQEENNVRRREKVMSVICEDCTMIGSGRSLKRAKYEAACKLIQCIEKKISIVNENRDNDDECAKKSNLLLEKTTKEFLSKTFDSERSAPKNQSILHNKPKKRESKMKLSFKRVLRPTERKEDYSAEFAETLFQQVKLPSY